MHRRTFVVLIGGLIAAPGSTHSQERKTARIGWVGGWYSTSAANGLFEAFRQGMRELGYVEGQSVSIDPRWMEGTAPEEAARLSAELVRSKVDVLVAQGHAVLGAKAEAASVPIVFIYSRDPVGAKIVPNLGRPEGNLTGITLQAVDLAGKRIAQGGGAARFAPRRFCEPAPPRRGHRIPGIPNRGAAPRTDASAVFRAQRRGGERSARHDGARSRLMIYGPNLQDSGRHIATYVDKILKGAKPADLPVEQPRKPQLVINLRTAKALGLTIPVSLRLRADRIVE
jgi:putative ABC transport system substrate-binding protein